MSAPRRSPGRRRSCPRGLRQPGLERLVRDRLRGAEEPATEALVARLSEARKRRYLTPSELEAVCRWKSPRAIPLVRANSRARIRAATGAALTARGERGRIEAMTSLKGVSVPMASAALTLLYPSRYGVLDIRVWQLLREAGLVTGAPRGAGFTADNWLQFLAVIRSLAAKLRVGARAVEWALFLLHKERQAGRLYGSKGVSGR